MNSFGNFRDEALSREQQSGDRGGVLHHSGANVAGLTVAHNGKVEFYTTPDLQKLVDLFDHKLSRVAFEKEKFGGPLDSPAHQALLRSIAQYGSELYRHIVKDGTGNHPATREERIQVVSLVPEARLPAELMYEAPFPAEDAKLCPRAAEQLRSGACTCSQGASAKTICPFGFWGISKILERHSHVPGPAGSARAPYAFMSNGPETNRSELDPLRSGVCGWAKRVEISVPGDGLAQILRALGRPTNLPKTEPAMTWDALAKQVATCHPSLILLIVHTAKSNDELWQKAELGEGSWLDVRYLDHHYVRAQYEDPPPMVVVLGCESGAPVVDFLGFASRLRAAGAAIVITSNSVIHSIHAVPTTNELLRGLRDLLPAHDLVLGEVMRTVRRRLLADGNLVSLSLSVFGDADWRLVSHVHDRNDTSRPR